MSINLTQQTVAFIVSRNGFIPSNVILNDTSVQAALGFSIGQDMILNTIEYFNLTDGMNVSNHAFTLTFFVSAANALTIIAGIPALKTRLQGSNPEILDIVTWGSVVQWG